VFENVIGHKSLINRLGKEIRQNIFPQGVLFTGPEYSGKLTTALEVFRSLSCEKGDAKWNCQCGSCTRNRYLSHSNLKIIGPRYFYQELNSAADIVKRNLTAGSCFYFLRAVRKLTRRFDPNVWEGDATTYRKVGNLLEEIEEELESFAPYHNEVNEKERSKAVDSVIKKVRGVLDTVSLDTITINHIRNLSYWSHLSTSEGPKAVILENAHLMQESSRNALLKTLEEPPPQVYFFLISPYKNQIIPTILSRLRVYDFSERTKKEIQQVLRRILKEEQSFETLRDYFLNWADVDIHAVRAHVNKFIHCIMETEEDAETIREDMEEAFSFLSNRVILRLFFEELIRGLREYLFKSAEFQKNPDIGMLEQWNKEIQDGYHQLINYNISPGSVLKGLFYSMRSKR